MFAHLSKTEIGIFEATPPEGVATNYTLLCAPIRPPRASGRICLLWQGTRFDLLQVADAVWNVALQPV